MKNRFYDYNTYFQNRYGHRVHKITLDTGLHCPNRDGTLSTTGCIYCNIKGSGTGQLNKGVSITQQIENGLKYVKKRYKAKKFIAYFQSFTNTYGPFEKLKSLYETALAYPDMIGLAIGTRPDCVDGPILDLLEGYARDYLIWLEYGLQSVHDRTLQLINRGHDVQCYIDAVNATKNRNIKICTHLIFGLPGENKQDMLDSAKLMTDLKIDGVKIHLLYVVKNTPMAAMYESGQYTCLTQDEYVDIVCDFLEQLPPEIVVQRITSDPHPYELLAPAWALQKKETIEQIKNRLAHRDTWQGKYLSKADA